MNDAYLFTPIRDQLIRTIWLITVWVSLFFFSNNVIAGGASPTVSLVSAPDVTSPGDTIYIFSVRYQDDIGLKLSTLGADDISVSGPNGPLTVLGASAGLQQDNTDNRGNSISADGNVAVFFNDAGRSNVPGAGDLLVPNDNNGLRDVFAFDRTTGIIELISVDTFGKAGTGSSSSSPRRAVNSNGRYVVFISSAENLVNDDSNGFSDIFIRDRQEGVTERLNISPSGEQANAGSSEPAISADATGRYIVFQSDANNLLPPLPDDDERDNLVNPPPAFDDRYFDDTNDLIDIFLVDRITRQIERINVSGDEQQAIDGDSFRPVVSANGRFVLFRSLATNLTNDGVDDGGAIFLRDRIAETTQLVEQCGPEDSNGSPCLFDISDDGDVIAFAVKGFPHSAFQGHRDRSRTVDTYFIERSKLGQEPKPEPMLVSAQFNAQGNYVMPAVNVNNNNIANPGDEPAISGDGNVIVFKSAANNLVPNDSNRFRDIFAFDRRRLAQGSNPIELISRSFNNGSTNDNSDQPDVSADGQFIVFYTRATDLVDTDGNGNPEDDNVCIENGQRCSDFGRDVFVAERLAGGAINAIRASGVAPSASLPQKDVDYVIVPPGGSWDRRDNNIGNESYTITLNANQVEDTGGQPVNSQIFTFKVNIPSLEKLDAETRITSGALHSCALTEDGEAKCWGENSSGQHFTSGDGRFSQISAGRLHTCAIANGTNNVECIGADFGNQTGLSGPFDEISAGVFYTCGIRGNQAECTAPPVGFVTNPQAIQPPKIEGTNISVRQVNAGLEHTCYIRNDIDGVVICKGAPTNGQTTPPSRETFKQISVGLQHTCGIVADDTVRCWGAGRTNVIDSDNFDFGQANPPADKFIQISAGDFHTCGVTSNETIRCWGAGRTNTGNFPDFGQADPPTGQFKQVSAGAEHSCAVREDDAYVCWGSNGLGQADPPAGAFKKPVANDLLDTNISAGGGFTCALRPDGLPQCWGDETVVEEVEDAPPKAAVQTMSSRPKGFINAVMRAMAAGSQHACAIKTADSKPFCWGSNSHGQKIPTSNATQMGVDQLGAGGNTTCAVIKGSKKVECWGVNANNENRLPANLRNVQALQVSVGNAFGCMRTFTNKAECWGNNSKRQTQVPTNVSSFKQISAGKEHACGVSMNNSLHCWGANNGPLVNSQVPSGTFKQVTSGGAHSCAIRSNNGAVVCWGNDRFGQTRNPSEAFLQISAGDNHTCGITTSGESLCWGSNGGGGRAAPPEDLRNRSVTVNGVSSGAAEFATAQFGAQVTVRISERPTSNVIIDIRSTDTTKGVVSPSFIAFPLNTNQLSQTFTITRASGNSSDEAFLVELFRVGSGDSDYSQLDVPDVLVISGGNNILNDNFDN